MTAISVDDAIAGYIDHTILKPDASASEVDRMCEEAVRYGFASVCVNPTWVRRVAGNLRGSDVLTCSVVGFPLGAHTAEIKAMEARRALREGAREIDMVVNIGKVLGGDWEYVTQDIEAVVGEAHGHGAVVKVIFENVCKSRSVVGLSVAFLGFSLCRPTS